MSDVAATMNPTTTAPSDQSNIIRESGRIGWIDDARGIGIILVVVGHVLRGLVNAGILGDTAINRFVDAWIYAFHMPLFFILSGLFAERKTKRASRAFLVDQAAVIIYPYLLWSIIQTSLQISMSGSVNKAVGLRDLVAIPTTPVMQFWFLYALFLIACIYQVQRRVGLRQTTVTILFTLAWAVSSLQPDLIPWYPLRSAFWYGVFYALGALANQRGRAALLDPRPMSTAAIAAVGGVMVAIWVASNPRGIPDLMRVTGDLAAALCGSTATIAVAVLTARGKATRVLGTLGRASLQIYVAHTIFTAATRIILLKVFKVHSPIVHVGFGTVVGLFPPLLLAYLAERWAFPYLFRWPVGKSTTARA